MVKKVIFLLILTLLFLSGCSNTDYTEPENRTVVTAMFIKFENASYNVMLETVNAKEGGKEEKYKAEYLSGEAASLEDTIKTIQSEVSSELSLFHCPLIICDNATYQAKKSEIFDYMIKNPQISLAAYLILTDNYDYFQNTEKEDTVFFGYEITDMIELKEINTDMINILRGRENPPIISATKDNKFIFSEKKNG